MTLPLSERALREIVCRLKKIRRPGGFATDAGRNVVREGESASSDEMPWVSVFEVGGHGIGPTVPSWMAS